MDRLYEIIRKAKLADDYQAAGVPFSTNSSLLNTINELINERPKVLKDLPVDSYTHLGVVYFGLLDSTNDFSLFQKYST